MSKKSVLPRAALCRYNCIITGPNGEDRLQKKANDEIYIPVETKHRIANETSSNVVFIEIQTGNHLDENDIVRFEDKYGRI